TYRWLDGGFFLIQEIDLVQDGGPVKGMEVIGRERPFGAGPGEDVTSRYYGSQGETFDYVYEIDGDTLTIWGGEKGQPAYYRGTFDGDAVSGAWVYPGGGGYESRMTRVNWPPALWWTGPVNLPGVRPALVVLAVIVLLVGMLWVFQRRLIYLPDAAPVPPAAEVVHGADRKSVV